MNLSAEWYTASTDLRVEPSINNVPIIQNWKEIINKKKNKNESKRLDIHGITLDFMELSTEWISCIQKQYYFVSAQFMTSFKLWSYKFYILEGGFLGHFFQRTGALNLLLFKDLYNFSTLTYKQVTVIIFFSTAWIILICMLLWCHIILEIVIRS